MRLWPKSSKPKALAARGVVNKDLVELSSTDTFDQWVHTLGQNTVYLGAPVTYADLLRVVSLQVVSYITPIEYSLLKIIKEEAIRNREIGRRWA